LNEYSYWEEEEVPNVRSIYVVIVQHLEPLPRLKLYRFAN